MNNENENENKKESELSISKFLAALLPNRDFKPRITVSVPKGDVETKFRTNYIHENIAQSELSRNDLATQGLRAANTHKSQNVLIKAESSVCLILNDSAKIEALNAFHCPPSMKIQVGNRLFAVWLLNDGENTETAQNALSQVFNADGLSWLPMPELNLVEFDGENYTYTPIELVSLHAERRYTAAELINAADSSNSVQSSSEMVGITEIESSSGEVGKVAKLNAPPNSRLPNAADSTLPNSRLPNAADSTLPNSTLPTESKATLPNSNSPPRLDAAKTFLLSELSRLPNSSLPTEQLFKVAKTKNISERTLRRAKAELNVKSIKQNGVWCWTFGKVEASELSLAE